MAESRKKNDRKSGSVMGRLISGTYISETLVLKNIRYVLLVVILSIIYISNRFQAERVDREIGKMEQEVNDLRAEALSVSAEMMTLSRQSEVYRMVKARGIGLQELKDPPYRIVVSE